MTTNPILSVRQANAILRGQEHLPIALEHHIDTPGLEEELVTLRAAIRTAGKLSTPIPLYVTPAMARAMLSLRLKKNRKISRPWVERLKRMLVEGRFGGSEIFKFDWDGNFADGQHRCLAISETGLAADVLVLFGVNPDDFQTMDVGLRRSAAQFLELNNVKYSMVVAAIVRLRYRTEHQGQTPDDQLVYKLGVEMADDVLQRAIVAAARLRVSLRVIISAAALAYWMIATRSRRALSVDEFWDHLVEGDMLETSSPIHKLRKHFMRLRDAKDRKAHQLLTQTQQAAWIINAWNAWIAGDTAFSTKWTDQNALPVVK